MGSERKFTDTQAARSQVPLLIGLMGPSGGGKTFSALRLATGIQRVSGGQIYVVDTEARRSLHYADRFKFRHVEFGAPFSPLDYLGALQHCVQSGAKVVIVDSMSHEHEGPGGVLEMHEDAVQRMSGGDPKKADRVKMLAWSKPKAERRRLLNSILQMPAHFIFCFRAKEKIKPVPGKEPEHMGFMPIAGEEFVFEMTLNALLLPGAGGVPTWQSDWRGEMQMMKLPEQFRQMFVSQNRPFDEEAGEAMAKWAAGGDAATVNQPITNGRAPAVTREDITRLSEALAAIGHDTPEKRLAWVSEQAGRPVKHPIKELTRDELLKMMAAASSATHERQPGEDEDAAI